MRINTSKLGPWTGEAIDLSLTPELVDLCLNVDINIATKVDEFEFKGYDIKIMPDQDVFYIETSMIRYDNLKEDLYVICHAIMSKELNIMIDDAMKRFYNHISQGNPMIEPRDGIITTIWTHSIFTSLSFNIALLDVSNQNKVGVQIISGKGRDFNRALFHWLPGFDRVIEYVIEDSKDILTHYYRDVLYNALFNHVIGEFCFDGVSMIDTPVEPEVNIGQYKVVRGSGDYSNVAYLVNDGFAVPLMDAFYGNHDSEISNMELSIDCYYDVLNLIYGDVIKRHAIDAVVKRKSIERALVDIDKYQFITNSLNKSIMRPAKAAPRGIPLQF